MEAERKLAREEVEECEAPRVDELIQCGSLDCREVEGEMRGEMVRPSCEPKWEMMKGSSPCQPPARDWVGQRAGFRTHASARHTSHSDHTLRDEHANKVQPARVRLANPVHPRGIVSRALGRRDGDVNLRGGGSASSTEHTKERETNIELIDDSPNLDIHLATRVRSIRPFDLGRREGRALPPLLLERRLGIPRRRTESLTNPPTRRRARHAGETVAPTGAGRERERRGWRSDAAPPRGRAGNVRR